MDIIFQDCKNNIDEDCGFCYLTNVTDPDFDCDDDLIYIFNSMTVSIFLNSNNFNSFLNLI